MTRVGLGSSMEVELVIDLESGGAGGTRDTAPVGVSSLQDAQRLLDRLWGGDGGGCPAAAAAAGRNRPAGSLGLVRSHSVTIPSSDGAVFRDAASDLEEGDHAGTLSPPAENNKAQNGRAGSVGKQQRRQRSPNSRKPTPPKPPRPPRAPSLDAADLKLVKEMSELAMLRRARMEKLRAIRKMRAAAAGASSSFNSSSSSSSFFAFVVTLFFCIVIVWQGFYTRNGSSTPRFEGSPVSSLGASRGGLISVQYFKNSTSEPYISSSASPNMVEQASGWG